MNPPEVVVSASMLERLAFAHPGAEVTLTDDWAYLSLDGVEYVRGRAAAEGGGGVNLHINTGGGANLRRYIGRCWGACGIDDAPQVRTVPGSPYYGDDFTCTICGDSWTTDGGYAYLSERPFQRGWRQRAIATATTQWDVACECPITRDGDLYVEPCKHRRAAA